MAMAHIIESRLPIELWIKIFEENSAVARFVRKIVIPSDSDKVQAVDILECLKGKADLREFSWRLDCSEDMSDLLPQRLLQYWPSCRLSVEINSPDMLPDIQKKDGALPMYGLPSLASFNYTWNPPLYFEDDEDDDEDFYDDPTLGKMFIRSCPNIEALKLTLQMTRGSRHKYMKTFMLGRGERLPALKRLELQFVYLPPGQGLLWSKCANWGRLTNLVLAIDSPQEFIEHFTGLVPNLSSFEIRIRSPIDEDDIAEPLISFLKVVTSLRYQSIESDSTNPFLEQKRTYTENSNSNYFPILPQHSVFYLCARKSYDPAEIDRHLHAEDIENIRQWFPNIRDFAFDLDLRGCLTYELLTSVSRHQNIEHLQIHLPYNLELEKYPKIETIQKWFECIFNHIDSQRRVLERNPPFWSRGKVLELKSLAIAFNNWDKFDLPYGDDRTDGLMYRCRRMPNGQIGKAINYPLRRYRKPRWYCATYKQREIDNDLVSISSVSDQDSDEESDEEVSDEDSRKSKEVSVEPKEDPRIRRRYNGMFLYITASHKPW
ncbi:hypothetical protein MGYG_03983 [Nannizzia gypsea CBS 118893]|uniref:Uncharacterized protein n=1 Tax=Arthroderma gypseum (strain ATCC MYA-4604 / CBS 118893) TaxID=535722 RepID=E4UUL5_ARTGP|nr:hypothetical protein MGYG_03983 [Nannizzia gypsea CBS 118893]EFR00982.1 hypothetical protein MGYG_03983 [Nannizzia gypsea CBS 118893]